MNRHVFILLVLAAAMAAPACGGDDDGGGDEAVIPPDVGSRHLPTKGAPSADAGWDAPPPEDAYVPPDHHQGDQANGECCPVTFAYAPTNPAAVDSMVLRGSAYPLDGADGVALTETDGVWSGEACMAPDYVGVYWYDVSLKTGSDQTFESTAYNPYVATTDYAGDVVNAWTAADDCASLDADIHSKTSD